MVSIDVAMPAFSVGQTESTAREKTEKLDRGWNFMRDEYTSNTVYAVLRNSSLRSRGTTWTSEHYVSLSH